MIVFYPRMFSKAQFTEEIVKFFLPNTYWRYVHSGRPKTAVSIVSTTPRNSIEPYGTITYDSFYYYSRRTKRHDRIEPKYFLQMFADTIEEISEEEWLLTLILR